MRRLRAILFGMETLADKRGVELTAFNGVFGEAGLPWRWSAADYARLQRLASGGDILDAFIRFERPFWRNSEDMKHLLAAVRRRHATLCRSIIETELVDVDRDMAAVAGIARDRGLLSCSVVPWADAGQQVIGGMPAVRTYDDALDELGVAAADCVSIECTAEGFRAAADAGIATLDKLAIPANSPPASDTAIMSLLAGVHASSPPSARSFRSFTAPMIV